MIAHLRNVRLAPQKVNLVAGMVRRLPALRALQILSTTPKKGARVLERVLRSALANAEHNEKQRREDLYIKTLIVNRATHFRRGIPRARGTARPIRKFTSHVTVALGVRVPEEKKPKPSEALRPSLRVRVSESRTGPNGKPVSPKSPKRSSSASSASSDSSSK